MPDVLTVALTYLARGWSIIPVDSRQKGPPPFPWQPYQSKLPTEDEVRQWWATYPNHGIAIITGAVSGIVALDLDRHGNDDGVRAASSLFGWEPDGPTVATGGQGIHAYYAHPGFRVKNMTGTGAIAPGVELKGDGGFLYAPPSVHLSGEEYRWDIEPEDGEPLPDLPQWVMDAIAKPRQLPAEQLAAVDPVELAKLEGVSEGARNDMAARLAGQYFAKGLTAAEVLVQLADWNGKNNPPLSPTELDRVVGSIGKREQVSRGATGQPEDMSDPDHRDAVLAAVSGKFGIKIDNIFWVTGSQPQVRFVCGKTEVNIPAESARDERVWNKKMFAATHTVPKLLGNKVQPGWDHYLQKMADLAVHNTIDAGEDATDKGQWRQWMTAYLRDHKPAKPGGAARTPEEPVIFQEQVCVHLSNVIEYVNMRFRHRQNRMQLAQWFKAWGFVRRTVQITYGRKEKHTSRSMWAVPPGFVLEDGGAADVDNGTPF